MEKTSIVIAWVGSEFFLEGVHKEYVAAFIKGLGGKIVARTLVSQV